MVSLRSPDSMHVLESSLSISAADGYVLGGTRCEPSRRLHPKLVVIALYVVLPAVVRTLGYLPGRLIGEDLPPGVALEWKRWCTTPGYFVSELSELERDRFRRHSGDILAYSFENDQFAPPRAVDAWLDLFASASVRREHVGDARVGHFGFFRPTSDVTRWAEVRDFLAQS